MADSRREQVFGGTAASGDIAIGRLVVVQAEPEGARQAGTVEQEAEVLREAISEAAKGLNGLIASEDDLAGEILEFQLALLDDDDLIVPIFDTVKGGMPAAAAWGGALDREIAEYRGGGDDYLAARAEDLLDLKLRVLRHLGSGPTVGAGGESGDILIAETLTPSLFLEQDWEHLSGAALLNGSPTSHVAILARARNVNLIVGLEAELSSFKDGTAAVLDAENGRLVCMPSNATLDQAKRRMCDAQARRELAERYLTQPARTAAGVEVKVLINVDDPQALTSVSPDICDGIGLTRTEFMFESGVLPGEDEQYRVYKNILEWAGGRPVTIRTLDAGGDKPIPGVTVDGESNPFLGIRGIRLSLKNEALLATQLRALARAGVHGDLKVMVPMVTVPEEMVRVRALMGKVLTDLAGAGMAHGVPDIGMMVEVPAAALTAGEFDADFYSIGSNDLIQYTMAVARDAAGLADLADGANAAVLELIARTVEAGRKRGVEVSLCGDMASTPGSVAALLDTGLRTLSVAIGQVAEIKFEISRYGAAKA